MNTILAILDAVVNSLWQAVAVTVLVWAALRFTRRINAATRYAIWWATLGVVLILPVAPRLIQLLRPPVQPVGITTVNAPRQTVPAVAFEPVIVTFAPGPTAKWPLAVLAVWTAILLWRLGQIGRSYCYLRGVKRRATVSPIPLPAIPRRADLLISRDVVSPMAVGFLTPAVVLPESLLEELTEPEREHVLLHEAAHLAGYDDWSNLAMRLLGGALALHPVAIWILRRIEREREMACDDWVVARTGAARPYAASLAHLFELRRARRDELLASGIFGTGSRLGDRIEMLLRRGRTFSPRASVRGVAASTVALGALVLSSSLAPRWIAFAQQPGRASFEVASVKPGEPSSHHLDMDLDYAGARFTSTNIPLKMLIAEAYDLRNHQITGGPKWLDSTAFNIEAKAAGAVPAPRMREMLQSLLEERFKLAVHRETTQEQVYELVVDKGGLKLTDASAEEGNRQNIGQNGEDPVKGIATPVPTLAIWLAERLGRSVIDKTGLKGTYDFTLNWKPDTGPLAARQDGPDVLIPPDPSGPSIFTAVQEDLGLKLQSARGPVEILVIDHVEKPDAN